VFALNLMSAYEGEHTDFDLLGQANLTQNDILQKNMFYLGQYVLHVNCQGIDILLMLLQR
jgi:hypothetical protein